MKRVSIIGAATLACMLIVVYPAKATDFTLSDSAIMSLDYDMSHYYSQSPTASIVSRQDIPGTGVQFNIHFNSTNYPDDFLFQVSDKNYGAGTLANIDVGAYSNFALKFTLVSVDGSTSGSQALNVGALIGRYQSSQWAFHPELISLSGYYASSAVSTIAVTSASISDIGFHVTLFPYIGWSGGSHDVTLLVEPASGAVQIPEPSTWAMLGLAVVAFLGKGSLRRRSS